MDRSADRPAMSRAGISTKANRGTHAEQLREHLISVENFDAGAGLSVNFVQRFVRCASFWVGNQCPSHKSLLWRWDGQGNCRNRAMM